MFVFACFMTSTYFNGTVEGCFIRDVQHCSMYLVMVIYEVTTPTLYLFTVFFFEKSAFSSCSGLPGGNFAVWVVAED